MENIVGYAAIFAIVVPVAIFLRDLVREAFPRRIAFHDDDGQLIGIISAESVLNPEIGPELARISERVGQSRHVTTRAA